MKRNLLPPDEQILSLPPGVDFKHIEEQIAWLPKSGKFKRIADTMQSLLDENKAMRVALEKIRDELDGPEYGAYGVWASGVASDALDKLKVEKVIDDDK